MRILTRFKFLSIDKAFGGPKKRKHTSFGVLSLRVDLNLDLSNMKKDYYRIELFREFVNKSKVF